MSHRLTRTTLLPGTVGDVFSFFKNPYNLESITPPWLAFRILSTSDGVVREGTVIEYKLRLVGIPLTWKSRITEYVDDSHFVDEQITGPYARWYHRHQFRQLADGVMMTDEVDYRLPFGILGRIVHWLVVRHQLRTIFDFRTSAIEKRFPPLRPTP